MRRGAAAAAAGPYYGRPAIGFKPYLLGPCLPGPCRGAVVPRFDDRRTNALNARFSADHVCFTADGRHRRRVIGISDDDPEVTFVRIRKRRSEWVAVLELIV